jgi:hypothetical protein
LGQRGVGAPESVGRYRLDKDSCRVALDLVIALLVNGHDAQTVVAQEPLERVPQRPHRIGDARLGHSARTKTGRGGRVLMMRAG